MNIDINYHEIDSWKSPGKYAGACQVIKKPFDGQLNFSDDLFGND